MNWTKVDTEYDFQSALWESDSEALVIERQEEPWLDDPEYDVYLLGGDYEENPEPSEVIAEGVTERDAHEVAMRHIEDI